MRIEDIPPRYRGLYRKAMAGRSLKAAIRCHCLMCVAWSAEEVRLCTAPTCPLYRHRLGYGRVDQQAKTASECQS